MVWTYSIIPSIWKESILGNPINQEVYNSVSRNGETIIINNVVMEIGTIKTRHIYKQLIGRRLKDLHPNFISIEILILKKTFLGIKYIHCHTILLLNQKQGSFNIKFLTTFFILIKDFIGWSWLRVPFVVYINYTLKLSVIFSLNAR